MTTILQKLNEREFKELFDSFIEQTDRRIAANKASQPTADDGGAGLEYVALGQHPRVCPCIDCEKEEIL